MVFIVPTANYATHPSRFLLGIETIAHVRENGRITLMFCAFEGAARIVRLFGVGTVHEFGTPEYAQRILPASRLSGSRAVVVVDVHKASTVRRSPPYRTPTQQA